MGQRSPPIFLWYHIQASGLMPSPTVPSRRRLERIVPVDMLVAPLDESANCGGSGVENRDFVLFDDLPKSAFVGMVGRTFVHHTRGTGREGAVDDIAVPGNPAAIGGTPKNIVVAMIKDPLEGFLGVEVVASGGVFYAFGFSGRAARVKDKERGFAVERLGGAVVRGFGHQLVPPVVAARFHLDRFVDPIEDETFFDGGRFGKRVIDRLFKRQRLATTPARVGGDLEFCVGVVVAVGDCLSRKTGEDDRVDRANPSTGEHGDRQLRHHGHVDRNDIAPADAELLHAVGRLADFAVQLGISQRAAIARLAFPEDGQFVAEAGGDVSVEAVGADIGLTTDKPLGVGFVPDHCFSKRLEPVELFASQVGPELRRIGLGLVPESLILVERFDACLGGKFRAGRK